MHPFVRRHHDLLRGSRNLPGLWAEWNFARLFEKSQICFRSKCCSRDCCRSFFRKIFCSGCCKKTEEPQQHVGARKASMISSKKKSLTPTSVAPPEVLNPLRFIWKFYCPVFLLQESKPKIDASLVEHTSHMKGAIPVLPIWLAWFCCIMNCIGPGTGEFGY